MKRDEMPEPGEHQRMWAIGLRFCANCLSWVRAEEWNRQFRCPNTTGVCHECVETDDAKTKRVAPEARIELVRVKTPERLGRLWALLDEEEEGE